MQYEPFRIVDDEIEFAPELEPVEPFRLRDLSARELMRLEEPGDEAMLAGPLVLRGGRTVLVGDTGHGKTALALQLAAAILTGADVLGYKGAKIGPVVVLDLEQGLRTVKRVLREAGLADRDDVIYVQAPDGLALDSDDEHAAEFRRVIETHRPAVLLLDPFYKAHRGDANEERAVVDLMRALDALRSVYGFALILPAHPRKDPTSNGARKLTLHDVSGSGAITRGAEVVLAIERLAHGYARLRILKDRDGDLPVGEAWRLVFDRERGFRLDPKEEESEQELEERILADRGGWRISKEWAAELGIQHMKARRLLESLVETGRVEAMTGPPGRSPRAHCYRTAPAPWERSGAVDDGLVQAEPLHRSRRFIGTVESGSGSGTAPDPGAVNPDDAEVERLEALGEELGL